MFTEQKDNDEIRQDVASCDHYELLVNVNPNGLVSKDTIKYSVELKTNITTSEIHQSWSLYGRIRQCSSKVMKQHLETFKSYAITISE